MLETILQVLIGLGALGTVIWVGMLFLLAAVEVWDKITGRRP